MGETTIRVDEALLLRLERVAARRGCARDDLAQDMLSHLLNVGPRPDLPASAVLGDEDVSRRKALLEDMRAIRAMTEKPLQFDSTLVIREMRDADE